MRVLHVTEALGGGVQAAIANYVDGLADVDHSLFSRARDGQQTHAWAREVEHEVYEGGLSGFFRRLVEKVRRENPDVVHLHSSYAGIARAVLPVGTAVVYSPHCYAMERQDVAVPVRWGFAAAEFALARRRQTTVAVSPREARISRRLNRRTPARVVLNPSPFGRVSRRRGPWRGRDVVMVGRITPQKDPDLFAGVARACASISSTGGSYRFVWVGDGDPVDRAKLTEAGVEVTGWTPPEQVRERVADSALYLHSAAWEGGPVSTIEAAALGVPVLARSIPSMESLGYPLGGETVDELAQSVHRFFAEPAFAEDVAAASASVAHAASRSAMADELRSVYTSAATAPSRGRPRAR